MRIPKEPPNIRAIMQEMITDDRAQHLTEVFSQASEVASQRYLPWDEFRWRSAPDGLTPEEWWVATKLARSGMQRPLPLRATDGSRFTYALPDEVLRGIENADKQTSGRIGVPEPVTHDAPTRARYVVNSLIEEAITSSQLEGARTTYKVAKEMIRTGRKPRNKDELMILNNYHAMRRIGEIRSEKLTPATICEIHSIVTEGTLDDPQKAGRLQLPGEERVHVEDNEGNILHVPPPAEDLPQRIEALCRFANGETDNAYVPPVVRAIVLHFMLAYDHPFVDGNGRTARILFYWSMLNQDYWLTEFISISRLIKKANIKYARSFLNSEQDDGDLTYFIICQLSIVQQATTDLYSYLDRKATEMRKLQRSISGLSDRFNHRQVALIQNAIKRQDARYTVVSHAGSHKVAPQTARTDLQELEKQGLLVRVNSGRGFAWLPVKNLHDLLVGQPLK
ncbi:Fic family protein [Streptosporangium saharense]|uniref:Fic family protein n=1 Tax=Streptosporangium saharense TaxID=1706840 RepID=UPI0036BFBB63